MAGGDRGAHLHASCASGWWPALAPAPRTKGRRDTGSAPWLRVLQVQGACAAFRCPAPAGSRNTTRASRARPRGSLPPRPASQGALPVVRDASFCPGNRPCREPDPRFTLPLVLGEDFPIHGAAGSPPEALVAEVPQVKPRIGRAPEESPARICRDVLLPRARTTTPPPRWPSPRPRTTTTRSRSLRRATAPPTGRGVARLAGPNGRVALGQRQGAGDRGGMQMARIDLHPLTTHCWSAGPCAPLQ